MTARLNPLEQNTLSALIAGLNAGMDPSQGLSIFNSLQGEAQQRQEQHQAQQQQQLAALRQLAVQRAQEGVPEADLRTEMQALMPHMAPRASMGLDDTMTTLYPGAVPNTGNPNGSLGGLSTLAPAPPPPPPLLDDNDIAGISSATSEIVSQLAEQSVNGQPPPIGDVKAAVGIKLGPALYGMHSDVVDPIIEWAYNMSLYKRPDAPLPVVGHMFTDVANALSNLPNRRS